MRQLRILGLASIVIVALFFTIKFYIADLHYYNVKNNVERWRKDPTSADLESIEKSMVRIDKAISLSSDNALYYQLRGQLHEWKSYISPLDKRFHLKNATSEYKKSLVYRPYWAPTWINLAWVKWRLNELDEDFELYLANALKTGAQQASVHYFIVDFAFAQYNLKSAKYLLVYKLLPLHLKMGLQNPLSERNVLKAIKERNASELACRLLKSEPLRLRKKIPECR